MFLQVKENTALHVSLGPSACYVRLFSPFLGALQQILARSKILEGFQYKGQGNQIATRARKVYLP